MTLGQPIQQFVYRFLLSGKYEQIYSQLNESHKHSLYQTNRICKSGFRYHDVWSCLLCIYIYICILRLLRVYMVWLLLPPKDILSQTIIANVCSRGRLVDTHEGPHSSKNRVYCAIYMTNIVHTIRVLLLRWCSVSIDKQQQSIYSLQQCVLCRRRFAHGERNVRNVSLPLV